MWPFTQQKPQTVHKEQLYEARRLYLEHKAAEEHHGALAKMYADRIERLASMSNDPVSSLLPQS